MVAVGGSKRVVILGVGGDVDVFPVVDGYSVFHVGSGLRRD